MAKPNTYRKEFFIKFNGSQLKLTKKHMFISEKT